MKKTRRSFVKKLGLTTAAALGGPAVIGSHKAGIQKEILKLEPELFGKIAANDTVRIACIGAGGMGQGDTRTALMVPGVEMVAACDLYDSRLERCKELWGKDLFTTKNYQEILDRKDIDAIICGTSDHWHAQIVVDAMKKGKAVYCEKPMTKHVEEGHQVINKQKETNAVFQVGSQYVSSIIHAKARELFEAGEIGKLNLAEAMFDRHSFRGAWQYSIPLDASEKTVDWKTYISNTTDRPFDAKRFFRWRNYLDYGTGVAGDLFVHLLSMLHFITSSKGPGRMVSMGGLRYFNDGREVPDIQIGMFEYDEQPSHPAFNLVLRANFVDGSGGGYVFRLVGDEGEIRIGFNGLTLTKKKWPEPGMSVNSFAEEQREAYEKWYQETYPKNYEIEGPGTVEFKVPEGYKGDRYLHFKNFFTSIKDGKKVVEDATFGLRAAGPTLAGNKSYFEKSIVGWDPVNMKMIDLNR